MKMLKKLPLTVAITTLLMSANAMADSWKVVQEVTPGANITMQQTNTTTTASVQALNSINLAPDPIPSNIDTDSTQTVTLGTHDLTLTQDVSTTGSTQAANWGAADKITDLTQSITTTGDIQLNQNALIGNSNTQAINGVKASTIEELSQSITTASLDMNQEGAQKNTQTGNLISAIEALPATGVTQTIATGTLNMEQKTTTTGFQAGNALLTATGGLGGAISQTTTTTGASTIVQDAANNSYQAINYAGIVTTN